jgi:hypothetical protein
LTPGEEPSDNSDDRLITRTRAEEWARRAVIVGKLLTRPKGTLTLQKKQEWEAKVAKKASQIVTRVILPGEWYLVRWGGTRKGAGTFYTRPGLAIPTVHRTLRPLAYVPPVDAKGEPDPDAPAVAWSPRAPEEILALKVCDPACGSGTFPVAALRFLTDALYGSLHHYGRISETGDQAIVRLLDRAAGPEAEDLLGTEKLACRPSDEMFEPRLKAVLRRHVVDRCIYGVDLDPLAVELCRLSLWIETMDRDLPFSFLDHKVKCGNSLIGAWLDTFQHYPVMAWKNRDGGDKGHTNGVHFEEESRSKAIKAFVKNTLTPDLQTFIRLSLHENAQLFEERRASATATHANALAVMGRLQSLPVHAASDRARAYRDEVVGSDDYQTIKKAMCLWCACWFWNVSDIKHAPLPTTLVTFPGETLDASERLSQEKRFFHWEMEFPDVFNAERSGFDAILGNPPWDTAKPSSKEFFSNIDPLYRSYGKQEAIARQEDYFADRAVEARWLDYNGDFRAQTNFVAYAACPFGDPAVVEKPEDRFTITKGKGGKKKNIDAHDRWREARATGPGFSDRAHPYRHQGSADINLYKLFLEQAHALLRPGGRLGFVVPSGLYSDHGTGDLRRLFLNRCRWEWLFGFENSDEIFSIHRSYKFNPVIIEKSGETRTIRTAFMRRRLEDWESGEAFATPYSREQVERFSPHSKAILEIQSGRDLEILEKIYANSVLLGDDSPGTWVIEYSREFHMTEDSDLFPPRPKWEAREYLPDEYSRWIKGDWRPIEELWRQLGVDPSTVVPIDHECELRISAPDVERTPWRVRCAQPPYDRLPVPRANIPSPIVLSRNADQWITPDRIADVALPLYQGVMISQLNANRASWISGAGSKAKWSTADGFVGEFGPQFLIARQSASEHMPRSLRPRMLLRSVGRSTDERTVIGTVGAPFPSGHSLVTMATRDSRLAIWALCALLNSFAIDWQMRRRLAGVNLSYAFLQDLALPRTTAVPSALARVALGLAFPSSIASDVWMEVANEVSVPAPLRRLWALTPARRQEFRAALDAAAAAIFGYSSKDLDHVLAGCDSPTTELAGGEERNPDRIGFWRVDQDKDPELRHTVLTLVAFRDLENKVREVGGNTQRGIEAFLDQNGGAGWTLPESLRLADYGLGRDDRAKHPQTVASHLGPRFHDWQIAQTVEESWRECEIHAKNLGGFATGSGREAAPATVVGDAFQAAGLPSEASSRATRRMRSGNQPSFLEVSDGE